jgi:hypothetical protein
MDTYSTLVSLVSNLNSSSKRDAPFIKELITKIYNKDCKDSKLSDIEDLKLKVDNLISATNLKDAFTDK